MVSQGEDWESAVITVCDFLPEFAFLVVGFSLFELCSVYVKCLLRTHGAYSLLYSEIETISNHH